MEFEHQYPIAHFRFAQPMPLPLPVATRSARKFLFIAAVDDMPDLPWDILSIRSWHFFLMVHFWHQIQPSKGVLAAFLILMYDFNILTRSDPRQPSGRPVAGSRHLCTAGRDTTSLGFPPAMSTSPIFPNTTTTNSVLWKLTASA